jgi:Na+-driven multidrug efflux pump
MKSKLIKIAAVAFVFLFVTAPFVFAASSETTINNPLQFKDVKDLVTSILGYVVKIGSIIAIFAFVWCGFLFVQAQGNPEAIKKAKEYLKYTILGVFILLGAQLIATIVSGTIKSIS